MNKYEALAAVLEGFDNALPLGSEATLLMRPGNPVVELVCDYHRSGNPRRHRTHVDTHAVAHFAEPKEFGRMLGEDAARKIMGSKT